MTQDEIIRMAREAGFEIVDGELRLYFDGSKVLLKPNYMGTVTDGLKEFAALVAAHEREKTKAVFEELEREVKAELINAINGAVELEREACAKVCADNASESINGVEQSAMRKCAAAIRARNNHAG